MKVAYKKEVYPIIWIGEKTEPKIVGYGRLWMLRRDDGEIVKYVERLIWIVNGVEKQIEFGRRYIVMGGVQPLLMLVNAVARVVTDIEYSEIIDEDVVVPVGYGKKSWALIGRVINEPFDMPPAGRYELYNPPSVIIVEVDEEGNAEVKTIK